MVVLSLSPLDYLEASAAALNPTGWPEPQLLSHLKSLDVYSAIGTSSSRSASHASGTSCCSLATGGGGGKEGEGTLDEE